MIGFLFDHFGKVLAAFLVFMLIAVGWSAHRHFRLMAECQAAGHAEFECVAMLESSGYYRGRVPR